MFVLTLASELVFTIHCLQQEINIPHNTKNRKRNAKNICFFSYNKRKVKVMQLAELHCRKTLRVSNVHLPLILLLLPLQWRFYSDWQ